MPYQPFYERFPEIARGETRTLTTVGHPDLLDDEYELIESYCNDRNCDCRRVFLNVASRGQEKIVAVIAWGWESKAYYARWLGDDDPQMLRDMQGPILNWGSPQSELAPALLRVVEQVFQDRQYVARLKRHYRMFKETVDGPRKRPATKPPQRKRAKRRRR